MLVLGEMDEEDFSLLGDAAAVQRWCDAPNNEKIITYHKLFFYFFGTARSPSPCTQWTRDTRRTRSWLYPNLLPPAPFTTAEVILNMS